MTKAQGRTDAHGACRVRGYQGDYEVTVSQGGMTTTQPATITAQGGRLEVTLGRPAEHGQGAEGSRGIQGGGSIAPGTSGAKGK